MPKRILQGTVVSNKGDKTVVVSVERRFTDPVMKKTVRECRPVSKLKSWEVVSGQSE